MTTLMVEAKAQNGFNFWVHLNVEKNLSAGV